MAKLHIGQRVGHPQGYGYHMGTVLKIVIFQEQEEAYVQFDDYKIPVYILTVQLRPFIVSFDQLVEYAKPGMVLKITEPWGRQWYCIIPSTTVSTYANVVGHDGEAGKGIDTYGEVTKEGVHYRHAILENDFANEGYIVEVAGEQECAGKQFSYGFVLNKEGE